ncbi:MULTISPECIES: LuxR C-terminal-related transcriptional regulator [Streptomyces]|uniref:LuxR C-terminal-related transcriptional regulator n=1 Tax=Streptomyces changanensis TaxID=2964669 RepID=A0ABY5N7G2_9ACTN|nr:MULTISPECIES: LuxR C-terminal-related transcriptional regulator [Streptomyces]UUS31120.1 LuxR C-terminal-related transcriptional regulator [Streptomyces changanensis]
MPATARRGGAAPPRAGGPVDLGFGELYGRERELGRVRDWLELGAPARQLTLTGPAGVGKSHLAHAAVGAHARAHGTALLWADLADAPDGGAVWALLGARSAREAADRVGGSELLLVLDDCDRLVADIALDVAGLLRACPLLRVLVTSRVALDIRAERILPVGPLPTGAGSPAEAVFADRVRPYYRAGVDGGAGQLAVAEICRTLDGIPLAVEMAAEAVGTEGPRALLERLARGECPGRSRPRDTHERHRSVAAALGWAAGTLDAGDVALLRDLSVCETHVDLAAVRGVSGLDHAAAVAGVESLVHKSLLLSANGPDGEPEFRLTHMARCHHRAALARDGDALRRTLDRHAAHWCAFAGATAAALASGRHVDQVLQTVTARLPDLLKAVRHLTARGDHLAALRLLTALEGPLLRHRLAPSAADLVEEAAAAWAAGRGRDDHGNHGERGEHGDRGGAGNVPGEPADAAGEVAGALAAVGWWAVACGDFRRAERVLDRAASLAAELPAVRARVAAVTGELLRRRGEAAAAAVLLDSAVRRLDALGEGRGAAPARRGQALLLAAHGDPDAERPLLRALDDVADDVATRASLLTALARVRRVLGRNQEAYGSAREAARLLMGTGDPVQVAEALETMAVTSVGGGGDQEQRHAVARVLAYAEAIRRRYGAGPGDGGTVGALTERLAGSVDAALLRRLRRDAEQVSLHDALVAALFAPPPAPEPPRAVAGAAPHGLTPRQHEIALLVAEGLTNRQIARRLGISEWTVTNHLRVVMQKLDCASRVHVVRAVQGSTA